MTQANHSHASRFVLSFLAAVAFSVQAAIPVADVTGTGILTFEALPPTSEWSSRHVLPNSGTAIADHATLTTAVQTNAASGVNASLVSATGGQNNQSARHSTSRLLYTRPTG